MSRAFPRMHGRLIRCDVRVRMIRHPPETKLDTRRLRFYSIPFVLIRHLM